MTKTPVATLKIFVAASARATFFARLAEFATENKFDLRIARVDPKKPKYGIDMIGIDLVIGGSNILDENVFSLSVHSGAQTEAEIERQKLATRVAPLLAQLRHLLDGVDGLKIR